MNKQDAGTGLSDSSKGTRFRRLEVCDMAGVAYCLVDHSIRYDETETEEAGVAVNRDLKRRERCHSND